MMNNLSDHARVDLANITLTKKEAIPVNFSQQSERVMQILGAESVDLIIGDITATDVDNDDIDKMTVYLSSSMDIETTSRELRAEFDDIFFVN